VLQRNIRRNLSIGEMWKQRNLRRNLLPGNYGQVFLTWMFKERLDMMVKERYIIDKKILKLAQWRYKGTIWFLIQEYVYMYLSVLLTFYVVVCMWWAKPQVYGFTKVVKREYRSNRELFNLINLLEMIRRKFSCKDWVFKGWRES